MDEMIQPFIDANQEPDQKKKKKEQKEELSFEKMELSLYRAQLSMIRTATTLTTFGFAVQKLLEEKLHDGHERPILHKLTPDRIAMAFFLAGIIGLVSYTIKHVKTMKRINRFHSYFYYSGIMIMTYLMFMLTLMLLIGTIIG